MTSKINYESSEVPRDILAVIGVAIAGLIQISMTEGHYSLWETAIGIILILLMKYTLKNIDKILYEFVFCATFSYCLLLVFGVFIDLIIHWFGLENHILVGIRACGKQREIFFHEIQEIISVNAFNDQKTHITYAVTCRDFIVLSGWLVCALVLRGIGWYRRWYC